MPALPAAAAPVVILVPSSGAVGTMVTMQGTIFDSYEGDNIYFFFDDTEIDGHQSHYCPDRTVLSPSFSAFRQRRRRATT